MKKFSKVSILTIIVSFVFGLTGSITAFAATTPDLGAAGTFGILANTFIPNTANTVITGDLGYTTLSNTYFTRSGTTYIGADTTYQKAGADQNTALNIGPTALKNQACTPISGTLAGVIVFGNAPGVFPPGCYEITGGMDIALSATVFLDLTAPHLNPAGGSTWIFRAAGGDFTTGADSIVSLVNGANPCNVFWTSTGATSFGANTTFEGTVIDAGGISIGDTVHWAHGRALAFGGTVITNHDTITVPTGCAAAPVADQRTHRSTPGALPIVPIIGILKVPSPLALPSGAGQVTYNYTVWNVAKLQQLIDVSVVDDKCSSLVLVSGDTNNNNALDINEEWKYTCTAMITSTTTNTAIATAHSSDGYYTTAIATAIVTVAVGSPVPPPIIHVVKIPSQLTPLPFGGGDVTYTYTLTNPGVVAMHDVTVTDDKCSPVSYFSGDVNGNNLLEVGESWIYTCRANIKVSTGNVATAKGNANGFTAIAYAFVNVLVSAPVLPNTALPPGVGNISLTTIILSGIIALLAISLVMVSRKQKI